MNLDFDKNRRLDEASSSLVAVSVSTDCSSASFSCWSALFSCVARSSSACCVVMSYCVWLTVLWALEKLQLFNRLRLLRQLVLRIEKLLLRVAERLLQNGQVLLALFQI